MTTIDDIKSKLNILGIQPIGYNSFGIAYETNDNLELVRVVDGKTYTESSPINLRIYDKSHDSPGTRHVAITDNFIMTCTYCTEHGNWIRDVNLYTDKIKESILTKSSVCKVFIPGIRQNAENKPNSIRNFRHKMSKNIVEKYGQDNGEIILYGSATSLKLINTKGQSCNITKILKSLGLKGNPHNIGDSQVILYTKENERYTVNIILNNLSRLIHGKKDESITNDLSDNINNHPNPELLQNLRLICGGTKIEYFTLDITLKLDETFKIKSVESKEDIIGSRAF